MEKNGCADCDTSATTVSSVACAGDVVTAGKLGMATDSSVVSAGKGRGVSCNIGARTDGSAASAGDASEAKNGRAQGDVGTETNGSVARAEGVAVSRRRKPGARKGTARRHAAL